MDLTTVDQFAVFVTVVDEGSFAAAARRLKRKPEAIAAAIQRLETLTQLMLFDRSTHRPSLTDAGRALMPRARQIVEDIEEFSLTARQIAKGLEAEISLFVDAIAPMSLVVETLAAFHDAFPAVQVRVSLDTFEGVLQALSDDTADLGLVAFGHEEHDLRRSICGEIELVPVVSSAVPLGQLGDKITPELLRDHLQILLSTRSPMRDRAVHGVFSVVRWNVTELETKHALLLAGVGWGLMPRHLVAADIAAGRLVEIKLEHWDGIDRIPRFPLVVAHQRTRARGPAARWLFDRFAQTKANPETT